MQEHCRHQWDCRTRRVALLACIAAALVCLQVRPGLAECVVVYQSTQLIARPLSLQAYFLGTPVQTHDTRLLVCLHLQLKVLINT